MRYKFSKYIIVASVITNIANAGFMDSVVSQASNMMSHSTQSSTSNSLTDTLTKSLGVNPAQALGGTAALMSLASSAMPKNEYTSLLKNVPGLSSVMGNSSVTSALSHLGGAKSVDDTFKSLGMNKETVYKFAPALLGYISKYATADNIASLKKAWGSYLK